MHSILASVHDNFFNGLQPVLDLDLLQYFKGENLSPTEKKLKIFIIKIRTNLCTFWNYQQAIPFKALLSAVAQFWYFGDIYFRKRISLSIYFIFLIVYLLQQL